MEKKKTNKSINTVIYALLAVMLTAVVGVTVFTVASRRRANHPEDTTHSQISDTTGRGSSTPQTKDTGTPDSAHVNPKDTVRPSDPVRPADTTSSAPKPNPGTPSSGSQTVKPTDGTSAVDSRYFVAPVNGYAAKGFEIDIPVYSMTMNDYRAHTGVDFAAPVGSEVMSVTTGTVCKIWNDPLMGRCLTIDHGDGIYTSYMNLAEDGAPELVVGTKVALAQTIGAVGETALIEIAEEPHLHLEMKIDGNYVDPCDYFRVDVMERAEND